MKERRQLTAQEQSECSRLMSIYKQRKAEGKKQGSVITQAGVAEACGWTQSAFSQIATGKVALNIQSLLSLSKVLKFEPKEVSPTLANALLNFPASSYDAHENIKRFYIVKDIPEQLSMTSIEKAAFGHASTTYQDAKCAFWFEVTGDAMASPKNPSFPGGSLVLIDTGQPLESGKYYLVRPKDAKEVSLRQYVHHIGEDYLRPENSAYRTIKMPANYEIIGRVVDTKTIGL